MDHSAIHRPCREMKMGVCARPGELRDDQWDRKRGLYKDIEVHRATRAGKT
jgi:hypothetical protein